MNALHLPNPPGLAAVVRPAPANAAWSGLANACSANPLGTLQTHALGTTAPFLQTKLVLGHPADRQEREADEVAEHVMHSPDPVAAGEACSRCTSGPDGDVVQRQSESPWRMEDGQIEQEDEAMASQVAVQAASMPGKQAQLVPGLAHRIHALRSSGHAMPAPLRQFMEPRFGHDFARVRLHTGSGAAHIAQRLGARAFTVGRDVFFGRGEFDAHGSAGRRLIAHELTHVVQQGQSPRHPGAVKPIRNTAPTCTPAHRRSPPEVIRRVAWSPNAPTGRKSLPWGAGGPIGRVLRGATDAGTKLDFWRPDDGATYWCHGFTFGGSVAQGGPYSVWGQDVPTVLRDDGWRSTFGCMAQPADVMVFRDASGLVTHSGQIRRVSAPTGSVDESTSMLESKWGATSLNTKSWGGTALRYGQYTCYSKTPLTGVCNGKGAHEA